MEIIKNLMGVGLVLWIIAALNKKAKWSEPLKKIGIVLIIISGIPHFVSAGLAFYDGIMGNPKRF